MSDEACADGVDLGQEALCLSSSHRDGGVREKRIRLNPERWTLCEVSSWVDHGHAWARASSHIGAKYDLTGIALTFALPIRRETSSRWFCSELCADALDLPRPSLMAPGDLYDWVRFLNGAYEDGRRTATPA